MQNRRFILKWKYVYELQDGSSQNNTIIFSDELMMELLNTHSRSKQTRTVEQCL